MRIWVSDIIFGGVGGLRYCFTNCFIDLLFYQIYLFKVLALPRKIYSLILVFNVRFVTFLWGHNPFLWEGPLEWLLVMIETKGKPLSSVESFSQCSP